MQVSLKVTVFNAKRLQMPFRSEKFLRIKNFVKIKTIDLILH